MNNLAPPRWFYFVLFTVSGFAGLIYESIWSHYLKLFLGHAAYAQSLVLMIFMGGMALGAWLAARYSDRWQLPILGYAVVEGVIGLLALSFHGVFTGLTETFYSSIFPALDSATVATALKWSAAALLMVPQSILLGMTFPLMTGGVIRRYPDNPGGTLATLYFTNSIGAAVGVLASGFWFIGLLGLPGTIRLAGLLNLALGAAVVLLLLADRDRRRRPEAPALVQTPEARRAGQLFLLAAFVTGAASFIYEIGWIRMLALVLGSTTHAFELMLSAFITGLAFGGLYIRRHIDRVANPLAFAAWVQVAMGAMAALSIPVYGQSFGWMSAILDAVSRTDAGFVAFTLASHGIALAVMLPATFLAGMTLPLFTHVMMKNGAGEAAIGQVYAANTFGAIVGVLFSLHVGMPLLGVENLIGTGALLDVALGVGLLAWLGGRGARLQVPAAALTGLVVIVLSILLTDLKPTMLASGVFRYGEPEVAEGGEVPFYRDGKTATVSITAFPGGLASIKTNGKPDAAIQMNPRSQSSSDESTMMMAGALPIAYRPDLGKVALIGFGSGLSTHTVLGAPGLERADTIEIEPAMVAGARFFLPRVARAYEDPRSRIVYEDAKTYFPLSGEQYDAIISEPSNPWVSGVANLFSAEFYQLVTRYLADDGLMVQWIHFYEFNDDLVISILRALDPHFSDYVMYSSEDIDGILVAVKKGRLREPDFQSLFQGALGSELRRIGFRGPADFRLRRLADKQTLATLLADDRVPANSDFYPFVDQVAPVARFKAEASELLVDWTDGPLPATEMLMPGSWAGEDGSLDSDLRRVVQMAAARSLRDVLLGDQAGGSAVFQPKPATRVALATVELLAAECRGAGREEEWLAAFHGLAATTLPFLPRAEARAVVDAALPPACARLLTPAAQAWQRLYQAVADRDGAGMAVAAGTLSRDRDLEALDSDRRAYVLGAILLGEWSQRGPAAARNAWQILRGSGWFPDPSLPGHLRSLVRLAGVPPQAPEG